MYKIPVQFPCEHILMAKNDFFVLFMNNSVVLLDIMVVGVVGFQHGKSRMFWEERIGHGRQKDFVDQEHESNSNSETRHSGQLIREKNKTGRPSAWTVFCAISNGLL